MRLLSITHYALLLGANRSLLHLLTGLRQQHHMEVWVICPAEGPFTEALRAAGIPCTVLPVMGWAATIRTPALWTFPGRWRRYQREEWPGLLEQVRAWQPDVIHSNSTVVSAGAQLAAALNLPHVWHLREFGWADYQLVFPLGRKRLYAALRAADAVVAISKAIAQAYTGAKARVRIVYNGIGTVETIRKNAARASHYAQHGDFQFLMVGLLQPAKRQHDALRAFAALARRYPHARLVLVGNGQRLYTRWLHFLARWYGVQKQVQFTGYVARPEAQYAAAHVVLMCSHHEAMGRVTAEAMSYGKPVIGYRGGATPEIIEHGQNGWLYEDIAACSRCMEEALTQPARTQALGQNAVQTALERFSDEGYVQEFYEILRDILQR